MLKSCVVWQEPSKQIKLEEGIEETVLTYDSAPVSPAQSDVSILATIILW